MHKPKNVPHRSWTCEGAIGVGANVQGRSRDRINSAKRNRLFRWRGLRDTVDRWGCSPEVGTGYTFKRAATGNQRLDFLAVSGFKDRKPPGHGQSAAGILVSQKVRGLGFGRRAFRTYT
jgi:hypothetical protein